jgi:phage protein D
MGFKPNYNQQRAERNRLKQAKKDAKLREREEAVSRRKAEQEAAPSIEPETHETRDP